MPYADGLDKAEMTVVNDLADIKTALLAVRDTVKYAAEAGEFPSNGSE